MTSQLQRETVLSAVRAARPTLEAMGVRSLHLFGSVARNQATQSSDVDFVVEFSHPVGFFQLFQVQHYLEDLLERPVDLGTITALKAHLRQPVLEDMICVF